MKKFIKKLWNWVFHTEKGLYLFFGALTTLVSLIVFYLCNGFDLDIIGIQIYYKGWLHSLGDSSYMWATVLRNVAGILFAYVTNRGMVFGSTAKGKARFKEFLKFIASRLITFVLDLLMMYVMVDIMGWGETLSGLLSMIMVIILNYVLSKLIVFKNGNEKDEEE